MFGYNCAKLVTSWWGQGKDHLLLIKNSKAQINFKFNLACAQAHFPHYPVVRWAKRSLGEDRGDRRFVCRSQGCTYKRDEIAHFLSFVELTCQCTWHFFFGISGRPFRDSSRLGWLGWIEWGVEQAKSRVVNNTYTKNCISSLSLVILKSTCEEITHSNWNKDMVVFCRLILIILDHIFGHSWR